MARKSTRRAAPSPAAPGSSASSRHKRGVFISYRREDSDPESAHLYASLSQKFGADSVFRDLAAIQLGDDFPAVVREAIRDSTVVLALIGPTWLTVKRAGRRRLDDPKDFVRLEIETALTLKVPLIPVLVGGAKMPSRAQLPPSISELATRNAYTLPWQEGIVRLSTRIAELEGERTAREDRERAKRERLDLTQGRRIPRAAAKAGSYDVAIRAMEMSLALQGRRMSLDVRDVRESLNRIAPSLAETGGYMIKDLIYVIDVVGVLAKGSKERFVARSLSLSSFDDIAAQLQLDRPVLVSVKVFESWDREPALTTGFIDEKKPGDLRMSVVGAILGFDPLQRQFRILMPWPKWGDKGVATLTMKAALKSLDVSSLRSIEAASKPVPSSPLPAGFGNQPTTGPSQRRRV